jgi:hypothetical protein
LEGPGGDLGYVVVGPGAAVVAECFACGFEHSC